MEFTAIAFRTGSRTKGKGGSPRIHLFWQKRVRADDRSTAFWDPARTGGGALREDRLVFPIPAGTHWREVLPIVLPGMASVEAEATPLPSPAKVKLTREERMRAMALAPRRARGTVSFGEAAPPTELELKLVDPAARDEEWEAIRTRMRLHPPKVPTKPLGHFGPIWHIPDYDDYQPNEREIDAEIVDSLSVERKRREAKRAAARAKKEAAKVDPRLVAFAREMRARWMESAAAIAALTAKHDVARRIEDQPSTPALPVAA